jgi:hypothetical protein
MSLQTFVSVYAEELRAAVEKYPEEYGYPVTAVPGVVEKMTVAFAKGTYNKDGRAIRATCKRLGIGYTYRDINAYIKMDPVSGIRYPVSGSRRGFNHVHVR